MRAWLDSDGQLRLRTSLGPLDILLRLPDGRGYDDVLPRSVELAADGIRVRLIDLPALIELKANTGRAPDRTPVPVLVALLEARAGGADASAGPYLTSMARPARRGRAPVARPPSIAAVAFGAPCLNRFELVAWCPRRG